MPLSILAALVAFWLLWQFAALTTALSGVLDIAPESVVEKGRLQPGRMFLVDTVRGRIVHDDEIKAGLAQQ